MTRPELQSKVLGAPTPWIRVQQSKAEADEEEEEEESDVGAYLR